MISLISITDICLIYIYSCGRHKRTEKIEECLYEFLARARSRCITLQSAIFCMSVMSFEYRIVSENRPSALQRKNKKKREFSEQFIFRICRTYFTSHILTALFPV